MAKGPSEIAAEVLRRSLVNIGAPWPDLDEAEKRVHQMQTKLHQWAGITRSNGMISGRAGCGESRTSGSEGGPGRRVS